jgi:ABC-type antimicrobial peptide transport system permease subunit
MPFVPSGQSLVLSLARNANAASILGPAREAVARAVPSVAVQEATTMERVVDRAVGPVRQVMSLLALLTGLALTLGAVGVYGVISHFASRRQRDWGIRVALGLKPAKVIGHVVGRGVALVGGGVALGIVGALLLARLLGSLLYGVGAADPIAYGSAGLTLIAIGVVAAWLPARRASRVDPAVVLRES